MAVEIKPPLRRWEIALIFVAALAGLAYGIPLFFSGVAWLGKHVVENLP